MPKYEGYLMKNSDLVIRRRDDADTSWVFNNEDVIDQYLGFIDTDDYEQAESTSPTKRRRLMKKNLRKKPVRAVKEIIDGEVFLFLYLY